jgi:hypothetical protein
MKKLIEKYNKSLSLIDLHNIQHYIEKKIDRIFKTTNKIDDLWRSKYYYSLFLEDDLIYEDKFWYRIEISWLWKSMDWNYYLIEKKRFQWNNLISLYSQVIDYFNDSLYLYLNPYYNENNG